MAASAPAPRNNPPDAAVAAAIGRHLPRGAALVVGLSGGIDSVVLLHCALSCRGALEFRLRCVHVHHGLSPNADDWAQFCRSLCQSLGVPLELRRVDVARDDPAGVEAAARGARRQVFAALDADAVLTAHHRDDQAETVLLQLLRGAGPRGLAAMASWHRPAGWKAAQLRPLLAVSRTDIRAYAERHRLRWIEDESNADLRHRRNALRHQVLPLIARHFPGCSATLARAAALQGEAAGVLDELAASDAAEAVAGEWLDCAALAQLSPGRQRNLLRHFIAAQGCRLPSERRLDQALRQLLGAGADAQVCVALGEVELRRFRGRACVVSPAPEDLARTVTWRGEAALDLPWLGRALRFGEAVGAGLKRDMLQGEAIVVRTRQGGERLRLLAGGPHRSLKNLLQEAAIPPWQRARLPLLWRGGKLLWAAAVGYDADCVAAAGEPGIILSLDGHDRMSLGHEPPR